MSEQYVIELRLTGDELSPGKIRSRDIAILLTSVEQMIAELVARDNPALELNQEEVTVGLAAVRQGSYVLQFQSIYAAEVSRAYRSIADAISTQRYANLPEKTIRSLKDIRKVTREYRTEIELWEQNGHHTRLATVSANTPIEVSQATISGKTTLYGTVIRVGGENPPTALLRLINGEKFTCNITERDSKRIARELGRRLYSTVGVRGMARWNVHDMSLNYFLIQEITPYVEKSIKTAVDELRQMVGHHYNTVSDIDAFVADIRGTDEDLE